MNLDPGTITALVVGTSFAAGINVYATVLTLGIMARLHWVVLPSGLDAVIHPGVLIACVILFSAEFVADKVPGFDIIWNAAHTFVRVPIAALLAYAAATHLTPGMQVLVTVLGALVAMVAHSSKLAVRAVVTPSPEPVSNIALSTAEDVGAIGLTWTATHHPVAAASAVVLAILLSLLMLRFAASAVRRILQRWRMPDPARL